MIPPSRFVPLAEETGLVGALTSWVLETTVRQAAVWLNAGRAQRVAVNLSADDLRDEGLPGRVRQLLETQAVPPAMLSLEITETALLADPARALKVLTALEALGIGASLDDFGTGYSSLTYLRQLPLRELKIDASFVQGLARNDRDQAIVRSTIELGHRLGLTVVAEGVEDATTLAVLTELGCDQGQGYFLGRPMAADDLEQWMRGRRLRIAPCRRRGLRF
jgi:EAL domain-containing protein (putative c-di-GMP-specific phosphodiesterase class I)